MYAWARWLFHACSTRRHGHGHGHGDVAESKSIVRDCDRDREAWVFFTYLCIKVSPVLYDMTFTHTDRRLFKLCVFVCHASHIPWPWRDRDRDWADRSVYFAYMFIHTLAKLLSSGLHVTHGHGHGLLISTTYYDGKWTTNPNPAAALWWYQGLQSGCSKSRALQALWRLWLGFLGHGHGHGIFILATYPAYYQNLRVSTCNGSRLCVCMRAYACSYRQSPWKCSTKVWIYMPFSLRIRC